MYVEYPHIHGTAEEKIEQISNYLFKLAEVSNYNLDQSTPESIFRQAAEAVTSAESETIEKGQRAKFGSLRDLIIKSAGSVMISQEEISHSLAGLFVATSDFGTFKKETEQNFSANSESFKSLFKKSEEITTDLTNYKTEMQNYIFAGYDGDTFALDVGLLKDTYTENGKTTENGTPKKIRITPSRLSLFSGDYEAAYLSENAIYFPNANITGGTLNIGSGRFTVDSEGALSATGAKISGDITATSGSFSGELKAATGSFKGNLEAAGGTFSGELKAATGSFAGSLSAAKGTFAGSLEAAGGTFSGELKAATGSFAGSLSAAKGTFAGSLEAAGGTFSGELKAATGSFAGSLSAAKGTFAGSLSAATGTFKGTLEAAGGTFSGELKAATGSFAGSLSAAGGTFAGSLSAATGTFKGNVDVESLKAEKYIYVNGDTSSYFKIPYSVTPGINSRFLRRDGYLEIGGSIGGIKIVNNHIKSSGNVQETYTFADGIKLECNDPDEGGAGCFHLNSYGGIFTSKLLGKDVCLAMNSTVCGFNRVYGKSEHVAYFTALGSMYCEDFEVKTDGNVTMGAGNFPCGDYTEKEGFFLCNSDEDFIAGFLLGGAAGTSSPCFIMQKKVGNDWKTVFSINCNGYIHCTGQDNHWANNA